LSTEATLPAPTLAKLAGKYLTFKLDGTNYGFDIHDIREIIMPMDIAPVPRAQPWIRGVINLRGKVIPVMDLRSRFLLPTAEKNRPNRHHRRPKAFRRRRAHLRDPGRPSARGSCLPTQSISPAA